MGKVAFVPISLGSGLLAGLIGKKAVRCHLGADR